jgi:hypothetical protein
LVSFGSSNTLMAGTRSGIAEAYRRGQTSGIRGQEAMNEELRTKNGARGHAGPHTARRTRHRTRNAERGTFFLSLCIFSFILISQDEHSESAAR